MIEKQGIVHPDVTPDQESDTEDVKHGVVTKVAQFSKKDFQEEIERLSQGDAIQRIHKQGSADAGQQQ